MQKKKNKNQRNEIRNKNAKKWFTNKLSCSFVISAERKTQPEKKNTHTENNKNERTNEKKKKYYKKRDNKRSKQRSHSTQEKKWIIKFHFKLFHRSKNSEQQNECIQRAHKKKKGIQNAEPKEKNRQPAKITW